MMSTVHKVSMRTGEQDQPDQGQDHRTRTADRDRDRVSRAKVEAVVSYHVTSCHDGTINIMCEDPGSMYEVCIKYSIRKEERREWQRIGRCERRGKQSLHWPLYVQGERYITLLLYTLHI